MMAKKLLPILILVIAVAATIGLIKLKPEPEQSEVTQSTILVDVISVQKENTYILVPSQGTVEPRTRTNLVSEVAGQVIEISPAFVAGGFFRQGDLIIRLDDQNYRAAVSRDEATVAAAKSQLEQERGQGDVALREWEKMTDERKSQIRAKALYLRQPQLEEALARLAAAEADLHRSRTDLSKTTIIAPYDGLVSTKNTDIGQFVTTGSTVAETFAVDYAEVRLPIPETKIEFLNLPSAIHNNQDNLNVPEVELISKIGTTEQSWTGYLTRTEGVLDTRTRVLFSVVRIEDPYGFYRDDQSEPLRIGTYVNANIKGKLLEDVVVLPRHTLRANNIVWVADPENRLRSRTVEVVTTNGDNVYISSGLQAGDRVITTRLENPLNSTPIQISQKTQTTLGIN